MSTATKPLDMTLDNGTFTLVEASAGTGKTWLIVALIVRLVVEYEIPIEEILLITFTRAATAEIRRRVRDRLVEVSTFLASNKTDPGDDALLARFLKLPGMSRKTAVERLERSLRDFDRAPISTIHSFCQRMLTEFACEADQDPGLTPVDKAPGVIADLVADVLTSTACVASPAAWSALRKTGWSEKGLSWIAAKMTGPSAPCVEPVSAFATCEAAVKGVGKAAADIAGAQQALADLLSSAEGTAYTEQLQQLCKTRHLDGFDGRQKPAEKARRWVESARLGPVKWGTEKSSQLLRYGTAELTNVWKPKSVDPATRIDLPTGQRIANALVVWEATFACVSNACSVALATFARDVRSDYEVQLARSGLLTYDSMLGDLAKVFDAADHAAANRLAEAIRRRYRVALVDEFQDTDHTQWTTLRAAFLSTETRLVVVGDPKQSIYAFRGAELDVYRAAVRTVQPQRTHTLDRNFRSDRVLVDALNALWQPVASVQPVMGKEALYHRIESKLPARIAWGASARDRRPLELRPFDDRLVGGKGDGWPDKTSAAQCLAEQCADECSTLLTRDIATIEGRALRPSDLAVLVRTNDQAATVKRALDRRGIASTLGGSRLTIDKTPPADWILAWLEALDDPTREAPARRLALTPLVGATLDEIAPSQGDDDASATLAGLRDYLHKQSESWFQAGMATLLGRLMREYASWPRILGLLAGARDATDLRHLMRVLDDAQRRGRLDPGALAASLRARRSGIEVSSDQSQVDDGNLELDGAGDAVRIVTIHAAKGLQYPVVLLPFAWDEWKVSEPSLPRLLYTPPTPLGAMPRRHLLLGPKNTANWQNALDLARVAGREESARMLYVAMTRAKHHVVAWVGCAAGAGSGVLTEIVDRGARGTGDLTPLALTTSLDALQSAHATLIR
ncbi:MAG: UvrD-helicase domain-containing protein, partial [Deltaproteobacteria bacterium]